MRRITPLSYLVAAAVWLLGSAGAWGIGFGALASPLISDPRQIAPVALALTGLGLAIGLALAVSATLAFGRLLGIPVRWFPSTALGVTLGLGIGFLTNVLFLLHLTHRIGMRLAGEGGAAVISPPAPVTLALAGLVLAVTQLPFMGRTLTPSLPAKGLWILGSVAAYGGGWSASAMLLDSTLSSSPLHGAVTGVISGFIVLLLVLVFEAERRRPTAR